MNAAARLFALLAALAAAGCAMPAGTLRFSAPEGRVLNEFFREGPVAAHLVLSPGATPRLAVAFPAGNSGAAIWFDAPEEDLRWEPGARLAAAGVRLPDGNLLRGVTADLAATGGVIRIRQALVGSVRVLRDYEQTRAVPPAVEVAPEVSARSIRWQRRRLDGAPGYRLAIEVLAGTLVGDAGQPAIVPDGSGRLRLRVTALTGERPLAPVPARELLNDAAAKDPSLRDMLEYLSYREKLLAGSWRFCTYFGRDTLMSLRLLAPVLQAPAVEAGLGSVLERLNPAGEVAHEEDIGEYAVMRRQREGLAPGDAPLFDYKMIDDDFMLAVVAAHHLPAAPRDRAADFLARRTATGERYGRALLRNARFVISAAAPFAQEPVWRNLVSLRPGEHAGNWRDSEEGLGGGRYPYDVNGVFVPAALEAIARLHSSGLLQPYHRDPADARELARAAALAGAWREAAPALFDVEVAPDDARARVASYAAELELDPAPATDGIGGSAIRFRAVALDGAGRPIPVVHSDEAFALLFLDPPPAEVGRIAGLLTQRFPAGLLTGVGLLVANPVYAPAALRPAFDRNRYHGTVIWSWQQAMFAAGIERQLARADLTADARAALDAARSALRAAIEEAAEMRGSELWSWSHSHGGYRVEIFGQQRAHETESNAAQLWSTVHLARADSAR